MESESESPIALNFMAERTRFPAPGLAGSEPGGLGNVRINGPAIDHRRQHIVRRGNRVLLRTPGGGGYGPVTDRDPSLIRRDRVMKYGGRRK